MPKESSIWKWKNTAHITKMSIEGTVALASLAGAITTILIATKVIAGPASLALVASPAGIAVLFIAAVYFAAAAYASYQQMNAIGEKGAPGAPGKDADFAALISDVIKSGTIVEETTKEGNQQDVKQLHLKLSKDDYEAWTNGKNGDGEVFLYVLSAGKPVKVKFKHVNAANDNGNYKVVLTSPADKKELGMTDTSLKVAVISKDMDALKADVTTNLADVAIKEAISKVTITNNGKQF